MKKIAISSVLTSVLLFANTDSNYKELFDEYSRLAKHFNIEVLSTISEDDLRLLVPKMQKKEQQEQQQIDYIVKSQGKRQTIERVDEFGNKSHVRVCSLSLANINRSQYFYYIASHLTDAKFRVSREELKYEIAGAQGYIGRFGQGGAIPSSINVTSEYQSASGKSTVEYIGLDKYVRDFYHYLFITPDGNSGVTSASRFTLLVAFLYVETGDLLMSLKDDNCKLKEIEFESLAMKLLNAAYKSKNMRANGLLSRINKGDASEISEYMLRNPEVKTAFEEIMSYKRK